MAIKPTIIVAGYRRENSIRRLLKSLLHAKYPSEGVKVIISLDGGYSTEVLKISQDFENRFEYGEVTIINRDQNIGLRSHMLWCGKQALNDGSVIVLEDDIYVDPQFYMYSLAALNHYGNSEKIAGIALYSQRYNEYADLPFIPFENGYSTYLMQVACSWGQLWTAEHWKGFQDWYSKNQNSQLDNIEELPEIARKWSNNSWKKYFSAYIAITNKYFVYPYRSYTTNCCDLGGKHNNVGSNRFQVPMALPSRKDDQFTFCKPELENIVYDSYMEPSSKIIKKLFELEVDERDLCIDFYSSKPNSLMQRQNFCITSKDTTNPKEIYDLSIKPFEMIKKFGNSKAGAISFTKTKYLKDSPYPNYYILSKYLSNFSAGNKSFIKQLIMFNIKKIFNKKKAQ